MEFWGNPAYGRPFNLSKGANKSTNTKKIIHRFFVVVNFIMDVPVVDGGSWIVDCGCPCCGGLSTNIIILIVIIFIIIGQEVIIPNPVDGPNKRKIKKKNLKRLYKLFFQFSSENALESI